MASCRVRSCPLAASASASSRNEDGVDHHAVADDIGLSALKNAGRDRTQNIFLTAELQRVTGIGTALEPGHHLVTGRQHIHDLSLALVPPLQAEDYVYFFHCNR